MREQRMVSSIIETKQKRRGLHRHVCKSRNHVIDRFRILDQVSRGGVIRNDDDSSENAAKIDGDAFDDDAYVDLEDFLVDDA